MGGMDAHSLKPAAAELVQKANSSIETLHPVKGQVLTKKVYMASPTTFISNALPMLQLMLLDNINIRLAIRRNSFSEW